MLSFFSTIIEYIQIIWSFFLNTITGTLTAITTLVSGVATASVVASSMPWFLGSSYLICIFVVVINYIIGRSNQ